MEIFLAIAVFVLFVLLIGLDVIYVEIKGLKKSVENLEKVIGRRADAGSVE